LNYFSEEVVRRSIEQADILKLNEDELPKVADLFGLKGDDLKIIRQLIEQFQLTFVVYTKGAECSIVVGKDGQISHIDTPKVEVADTVGAGDAFTATFVTMLLQGAPMEECHRRAVEISAFVCTQNGAITPL
jgi:fructokinase